MATLETNQSAKQHSGKKLNKKSTRVDLTPMVDLGFLLITFFVFTTAMTVPRAMKLIVPTPSEVVTPIPKSKVLTVIPYSNDVIKFYEGELPANGKLNETTNSVNGLREIILDKKKRVQAQFGSNEMILVIKPANESSYKNFVDILDEVSINDLRFYFIDKLSAEESKLLQQ
jgi:biopolymer transport protein ExbD